MADHEIRPPKDTLEEGESVRQWIHDIEPLFSTDREGVRETIRVPDSVTHFLARPGEPPIAVCRITMIRERQRWEVVWLLPIDATIAILSPLLASCAIEAGRRFPGDPLDWPIRGSFGFGRDAQMRALAWQQMFAEGTTEVLGMRVPGDRRLRRWSIQMGAMRDAIRAMGAWL